MPRLLIPGAVVKPCLFMQGSPDLYSHLTYIHLQVCLIAGIGSELTGSTDLHQLCVPLLAWVREWGGTLLLQGEGAQLEMMLGWFGKIWRRGEDWYSQDTYTVNRSALDNLGVTAPATMSERVSVRGCRLLGVPPEERLLGTDDGVCVAAACEVGLGLLAFVGDVNAESETVQLVCALAGRARGERASPAPKTALHDSPTSVLSPQPDTPARGVERHSSDAGLEWTSSKRSMTMSEAASEGQGACTWVPYVWLLPALVMPFVWWWYA